MITNDLSDDTELKREIRNVRANTISSRFGRGSLLVKAKLYTTSACVYMVLLCEKIVYVPQKIVLSTVYSRCMKMFLASKSTIGLV